MLREIITHGQKTAEATYKAATDMKTGMAVVKNVDGTTSFPAAATASNLYFTQKARVPTGLSAARTNISDYDDDYNTIKEDDPVVLCQYSSGEKIAIDGVGTLDESDIGKTLMAGTDGKLVRSNVPSSYQYLGAYNDAGGHTLAKILVLDSAMVAPTLSSIEITDAPTKTTYVAGEAFASAGMVVTATYSDSSTRVVTTYTYAPTAALTTSDTTITITYVESGVTKTDTQTITVNAG